MIPRLDILIDKARESSIAKSYSDTHGLSQDFFVIAAQNAIWAIQRGFVNEGAEVQCAWQEDSIVANQEAYANPTDILARHLVHQVQFSSDGTTEAYEDLQQSYSRGAATSGLPEEYYQDGGYTYIWPVPSSATGKIRRRYEQRLNSVDISRGVVSSTTGVAPAYATIVLAASPAPDAKLALGPTAGPYQYVTAVDTAGNIKCRAINVASYTSGTRTLTMASGWTGVTGETVSAGNIICLGRSNSTHPLLDDCCEDFLIAYMIKAAEMGRSSVDVGPADGELARILQSLIELYSQYPTGKKPIPETRGEW